MKVSIKKEFDGNFHVASCGNIPGCYVQAADNEDINQKLRDALLVYRRSCLNRNQPIPNESDRPVLNLKIRFDALSTDQLVKIFQKNNYHIEYKDKDSVLMQNSAYPFNRVHLPRTNFVSPLIVKKIFGDENTVFVGRNKLKLNTSAS